MSCSPLCWCGPHLESCVQLGVPQGRKDTKLIECFQRRATKMGKGLECMRQPRSLSSHSFKNRRLKDDLLVLSSLLMRGSKGAGAHPFSQTPRARTRPTAIAGSCLLTSSSLTGSSLTGLLGTEAGTAGKWSQSQICCSSLSLWTRLSDTWLPLEGVLCRARS